MRNLAVTLPDAVEHKTTLSISIKKQLKNAQNSHFLPTIYCRKSLVINASIPPSPRKTTPNKNCFHR